MSRYDDLRTISDTLIRHGHRGYLVGGAVRDHALGLPAADLDIATDATPERVTSIFNDVVDTIFLAGAAFGVVTLVFGGDAYEVATFRGDTYDGESRKPVVQYTCTIEEDLARRDFTINAMAIDLADLEHGRRRLIDPFGGHRDLLDGVLRTPGDPRDSFRDDPLRMMRAARFIARFGLTDNDILLDTVKRRDDLRRVSVERIRDELVKLLLVDDPTEGLDFLARTGLSDIFLPELNLMRMPDEGGGFKDVYTHTLAVVRQAPVNRLTRLAALFHDVAKPDTFSRETGRVSFHHHEVVGATMTHARMRALKFDNDTTEAVTKLVRQHLRVHTADDWTDRAVRRYIRDAGEHLQELNDLQRADVTTKSGAKRARLDARMTDLEARIARIQEVEGREVVKPPLDGRQVMEILGIGPGRYIGEVLAALLERRLDVGPMTESEAHVFVLAFDNDLLPEPR